MSTKGFNSRLYILWHPVSPSSQVRFQSWKERQIFPWKHSLCGRNEHELGIEEDILRINTFPHNHSCYIFNLRKRRQFLLKYRMFQTRVLCSNTMPYFLSKVHLYSSSLRRVTISFLWSKAFACLPSEHGSLSCQFSSIL